MLRTVLESLNIPVISFDLSLLPKSSESIEVFPGTNLPLYGELLVGEKNLFKKINQSITPYLLKLNNLLISLGSPNVDIEDLITQLQMGQVVSPVYKDVEVDYEKLGYSELSELAKVAGVEYFSSYGLLIDGETNTQLSDIVNSYLSVWFNNNIPGETGLDQANFILQKKSLRVFDRVEIKKVDSQKCLDDAELTWGNLETFKGLNQTTFNTQLLVYFRLGFVDFNVLEYLPQSVCDNLVAIVDKEINGQSEPLEEEIIANKNIQKQEETQQAETVLKPEEDTTTEPSQTQRKKKGAANP